MDGLLFDLGLPDETIELVIEKAGGRQLRIAKPFSKSNRLFRKKRNQRICQRRLEGATLQELINEFNLKKRSICYILKENGIHVREERKRSLKEEIKAMLQMGYGVTEIAKKVDVSRQTVYAYKRRMSWGK